MPFISKAGQVHDEVVTDDPVWTACQVLLEDPEAIVGALDDAGLVVDLPPQIAALGHRRARGRSIADAVSVHDVITAIETFQRARELGAASAIVRPADPAMGSHVAHFVDLRDTHGCWLAVLVPTDRTSHRTGPAGPTRLDVRPRFGRATKSQLAVFEKVDDAFCQLLGWTAGELVGTRAHDLVHPDDYKRAFASWIGLLAAPGQSRRVRLRCLRTDGTYAWLEVTNYNLLADPDHGAVLCDVLDVSQEVTTHEALRARQQLLDRLTEALPVGVLQLDADGTVVYANEQTRRLLGHRPTSLDDLVSCVAEPVVLATALHAVLSGASGAEAEVAPLQSGAVAHVDIVVRRLDDDGRTTGAVACLTDVTEGRRQRTELERQATIDPLTGTLNRAAVLEVLGDALALPGAGVAVVFLDLDGFKAVNDDLGHATGDEVLRSTADRLQSLSRETDHVGRFGGDEFIVASSSIDSPADALIWAERIASVLSADPPATLDGGRTVRVSVGVAWSAAGASSPKALVRLADTAMYEAKSAGDGRAVLSGF